MVCIVFLLFSQKMTTSLTLLVPWDAMLRNVRTSQDLAEPLSAKSHQPHRHEPRRRQWG